jgi:hypothetical protein
MQGGSVEEEEKAGMMHVCPSIPSGAARGAASRLRPHTSLLTCRSVASTQQPQPLPKQQNQQEKQEQKQQKKLTAGYTCLIKQPACMPQQPGHAHLSFPHFPSLSLFPHRLLWRDAAMESWTRSTLLSRRWRSSRTKRSTCSSAAGTSRFDLAVSRRTCKREGGHERTSILTAAKLKTGRPEL